MRHHPPTSTPRSRAAAFAAGRRLRRAAELRHARQVRLTRRPVLLALVLVPVACVVLAAVLGLLVLAALVLGVVAGTLLAGGAAFVVTRHVLRRRGVLPARPAGARRRPVLHRPDRAWAAARDRFHVLAAAYAAHECDPMAVLRLPALSDVTVPSTGRFVDAFAHAQALDSDAFPGDEHAAAYVRAVDAAGRAWRAAREAAERIRLSGLSPAERTAVERVIKLLTVARESDSESERLAAYGRARAELDRLDAAGTVHLPRTARAAIDTAARGALPA